MELTEPGDSIRVLLVDDHQMVRHGLSAFLQAFNDLELVGEAANGAQALQLVAAAQPDVVLMDMVMPDMSGAEATRQIKQNFPQVQIIALTSFGDEQLVQDALQAGAISFLNKDISIKAMGEAIRKAHAGQATLSPEATQVLINRMVQPASPSPELTVRERQVLALLAAGLNNPEIAEKLMVGRATVKSHVSNILAKLGVSNRLAAVTFALEHNLIEKE